MSKTLDRALAAYIKANNEVIVLNGSRDLRVMAALANATAAQLAQWRQYWPEALGLPPKPTRLEEAIAEARADVKRAEELRDNAKRRMVGSGRNEHSAYDDAGAKVELVGRVPVYPGAEETEENRESVNCFDLHVDDARRRLGALLNESKGGGAP